MFLSSPLLLSVAFALPALCQIVPTRAADNYTCSATQPCALGCCGNAGYCGFGPTFCGQGNCTSGCDRKSECDPGWGSVWSNATTCPLNVCCSQYGFCGTTADFCGNATVRAPSCSTSGNSARGRVVGYYEAWSQQRSCDQMFPRQLPQGAWTHLNFAFAYIDPSNYSITPMDPRDVPLYSEFTGLKKNNTGLETWISVGGWSMNDPSPTNGTFSALANSTAAQDAFATSLIAFMDEYGFDGVDIDWEYPVAEERDGEPRDFTDYVSWLRNLKAQLGSNYGLTITVPSSYWYMRHFDITALIDIVDWFNMMTYDLHGTWDAPNPYVGAYVNSHTNLTEINEAFNLLWRNAIPSEKVVMGLGFYGRSFTLSDPSCAHEGCTFSAGGDPGPCTGNEGTLSFAEIENVIVTDNASVTLNEPAAVQEVVWAGNQWVSYDDAETFRLKYAYANGKCIGGLMVWAASLDDRNGSAQRDLCAAIGCTVRVPEDADAPVSCGSTERCREWHTVIAGDTCYALYTAANITFPYLRALNPQLKADCSNLEAGYRYCIAGTPGRNNTASCASSSSTARPTSTGGVLGNGTASGGNGTVGGGNGTLGGGNGTAGGGGISLGGGSATSCAGVYVTGTRVMTVSHEL